MGKVWCDGLPVVTVPRGDTPKRVTLVVPYYESYVFLQYQRAQWALALGHPSIGPHVRVIVVDDGSRVAPAERATPARLFRIDTDVPWNWLAARNIGAHHAEDGWLLMTDMDHVVPMETWRAVVYGQHDPSLVYAFSRRERSGEAIGPHSASFLMTKSMFWRVGGYDERLSGVYGTDGAYRKRLLSKAPVQVLTDVLVRHEYVDDASVTTYERKTPAMRAARAKRFASVAGGPPKVLSFPYHEVTI